MHRLLERQLRRSQRDGQTDLPALLELVSQAYTEVDEERRRQERTNRMMSDELRELNAHIRAEAAALVRTMLGAVGDGVIVVDPQDRVEVCNAAAEAILGRAATSVRGEPFESLLPAAPSRGTRELLLTVGDEERVIEVTVSAATLDGQSKSIAIVRDVTEKKREQQRLEDALAAAETASRTKSEFLATMSHEIRTPMNGVLGMVGLILDSQLEPQQRTYADAIRESGEALLAVLNDILDFSKIEAGRLELEEYEFSAAGVVESVVELLAPRAYAKGLHVGVVVAPGVPGRMRGDAGRLRQIAMNLVSNAVKFTENGSVTLELSAVPMNDGAMLQLDVADTGIGMNESTVARLFSPFVQADASTTRRYGGSGLGLAICRQLADLMGGAISVESTVDVGSSFRARIPFRAAGAEEQTTALPDGLRCLIVDDNDRNREIFERQLSAWGMEVASAASGDLAIAELVKAKASGRAFHLVLLDHHMPGLSGVQLAEIIRATPMLKGVHLYLASSGLIEGHKDLFEAVFVKPVRPSLLLQTIAETHRRRSLTPPGAAPAPVVEQAAQVRLRILVAEDNPINQRVALGYLEKAGHRVDVASNGLEAVSAVRSLPYDLVLMDMQMPEMDGLAATRVIRKIAGERGRVPIVGLTANAMAQDREACLEAGMDDYLSKPVDRAKLLEKVRLRGAVAAQITPPVVLATNSPSTPSPAAPSGLDLDDASVQCMQELMEAVGEVAFKGLLSSLRESVTGYLAGNDESEHALHQLKGATGSLGFLRVAAMADSGMRLSRAGCIEQQAGRDAVAELRAELKKLVVFIDDGALEKTLLRNCA